MNRNLECFIVGFMVGIVLVLIILKSYGVLDQPQVSNEAEPSLTIIETWTEIANNYEEKSSQLDKFFWAIGEVESNNNDGAIGDNGRSIGRYQIGKAYWIDSGVLGSWEDCYNKEYAERVMIEYFKRYGPEALENRDWETLAKLHHLGPKWKQKKGLDEQYWLKIRSLLEK